jgi:RhtB (resistance to homoserine/threonine) family protein
MELSLQLFLAYSVFLGAMMAPGPDLMIVLQNALCYSSRSGIYTAAGIAVAACIHMAYCVAGIGLLISKSILLFNLVKFIGAAYLIYMGIMALRSKGKSLDESAMRSAATKSDKNAFVNGFITNLFNPKATLFFLALFTQVIDPDMSQSTQGILCLAMFVTAFVWFSLVSVVMGSQHVRQGYFKMSKFTDRLFGAFFIALGVKLMFSRK